jgi:chitin disaccharide deacetylase
MARRCLLGFTLVFLALLDAVPAQESAAPRLIVRGDDMGAAHAVNEAIIECHRNGIQSAIEVIVPSPWFPEAAKMLKEFPAADVGVHLALTSEWDNVKWRPLTEALSLRDPDGFFFPMIHPNKNYPGRALKENAWKLEEIEKEFRAQIEMAKKHIPQINHLSGHMGCSGFDEKVREMTRKLAAEFRLELEFDPKTIRGVSYVGPKKTAEEKIASLIKMLESLEPGKTYLFVDHPGLDTPEMRAIHHIGYEDVAEDRQGVTTAWTSGKVKEAIKKKGIELIGYGKLRK